MTSGTRNSLKFTFCPHFARFCDGIAGYCAARIPNWIGDTKRMKRIFCAGVIALAAVGLLSNVPAAGAGEMGSVGATQPPAAAIDIQRIRSALHLTQEQERYWRPVEAALRQLAHRQEQTEPEGFVHKVGHRLVMIALDSAAITRLATVARPLIVRLDDQQKQAAGELAQEMGLGPAVMAALN